MILKDLRESSPTTIIIRKPIVYRTLGKMTSYIRERSNASYLR
jgi:hypothetical protein